jgi:glutamine amidotransferase
VSAGNTIAVIDYGMGNLRSVSKALEHVAGGKPVIVTADPAVVAAAGALFPGQGQCRTACANSMRAVCGRLSCRPPRTSPFSASVLASRCFFSTAMKAMCRHSACFPAMSSAFRMTKCGCRGERLKVPHMGWNTVRQAPHALWNGIADGARFYFVHSYFVSPPTRHW